MSQSVLESCEHLRDMLLHAVPREVQGPFLGDVVHCYVDALYEPGDGFSGIYVDACVPVQANLSLDLDTG